MNFVRQMDGHILMYHVDMWAYIIIFDLKKFHIVGIWINATKYNCNFLIAAILGTPV